MEILTRNQEEKINKLLKVFPVVALIGARQTGKTALSQKLRPNWHYLDLENPNDFYFIHHDPLLYFEQFPTHTIFDEAQNYPGLFAILRGVIDADREKKGRFIITGSSSPELLSQISETLAGRIAIVEIGTLKANEYYQKPLSSFYQIFEKEFHKNVIDFVFHEPPLTNEQMRYIWLKGGYPEPLLTMNDEEYLFWMEAYRDTYINRDIAKLFPRLNKIKYQQFIAMLAKLSGTIINKSELGRSLEFNESTAREYLQIADKTFIWREMPSFEKSIIKSIVKMPKGHIRDTGLLHFLLNIQNQEMLYKNPCVGSSFEGFVIEEIIKGLNATSVTNWRPYYYRTRSGAEIDLILEGPFGILPIEIKYGTQTNLSYLSAMTNFIRDNQIPFGIVINQAKQTIWLSQEILQIPVGWI